MKKYIRLNNYARLKRKAHSLRNEGEDLQRKAGPKWKYDFMPAYQKFK